MTLLQFFFIISGVIILILAIDIAKKQRFNALHFLVFIGVGGGLLSFTFFPQILNGIGNIFGVARGADVLVYTSIIFLLYFVLLLLTKHVDNRENITKIIRQEAIKHSSKKEIIGDYVLLIRAFNEGKVIKNTIKEIYEKGIKNILVINDGSSDNTLDELKDFEDIIIVNHMFNRGAGAALETGFEYIRRYGKVKYIITFDADGQHSIDDLDKFLNLVESNKNIGIIFGSRFISKTDTNVPFLRKIILKLGKVFTYILSGVKLTDAHNGYRLLTFDTIKKIKLKIDTMAYASELIDEISKNKIQFVEVPVNIKYTEYSMAKGQSSGNAINIALRMIWSKFFK